MKAYIRTRIAAGATKSQIIDELVGPPNNMGDAVLGVPRKHGFDLLAWLLPFVGIALGAVVLGAAAWYWSRSRTPDGTTVATEGPPLAPELERRVDEELARFDV
jgi:cytochrome c-type biogenesis protein CcmH